MTLTHLSHFDAKQVGVTPDNVIFEGTLAACRRLAFSHGMEVDRYEGRTVSIDSRGAVLAPSDANNFSVCWFKNRGLIMKTRDGFCLVMPRHLWDMN